MSVKSLNRLSYILAGLSILLIIIGCFAPFVFTQCGSLVDFTETGQKRRDKLVILLVVQ